MSNKHLDRNPHMSKDGRWWWYEEPGGIEILFQNQAGALTIRYKIAWKAIRAALARKDRKP